MKMKYMFVKICLLFLFIIGCDNEEKEKLEFIYEIIQYLEKMDSIIRNSKFVINEKNYYDQDIRFIQKNLIEHSINIKKILTMGPETPTDFVNDKYVKFQSYVLIENHEEAFNIAFEFIKLASGGWKLKEIFFVKNPDFNN